MSYVVNFVCKEKFCDKLDVSTLYRTVETIKIHANMNGISSVAILGCGLDQMNCQDFLKLLLEIFDHADVQIAVYTLEEN